MILAAGLGIRFENEWIFREADFEVRKGCTLVIVGPSGSGKSTLLKMIAGLIEPSEGSVKVQSSNLGMLFQKNALFDSLTVEENLLFPMKERLSLEGKPAIEKARRFLKAVGLLESASLLPDEISGGMQKRLGIARALVVDPEVILYDDPTAGLDPITSKKIVELILELQENAGSTIVAVTNDMQRAYQLGDEIGLLARQRLVLGGSPEDVKKSRDQAMFQFVTGSPEGPLTAPSNPLAAQNNDQI